MYISYYQNYSIYEPAEGGYYYEGHFLSSWVTVDEDTDEPLNVPEEEAKEILFDFVWQECLKENAENGFTEDNKDEWIEISNRYHVYPWYMNESGTEIRIGGRYIGEGGFWIIEEERGSHEKGWQPYE